MKKQVSPAILIAAIAVVVILLGALFYRQAVYAEPTPRPNRGVGPGASAPSAPSIPTH